MSSALSGSGASVKRVSNHSQPMHKRQVIVGSARRRRKRSGLILMKSCRRILSFLFLKQKRAQAIALFGG